MFLRSKNNKKWKYCEKTDGKYNRTWRRRCGKMRRRERNLERRVEGNNAGYDLFGDFGLQKHLEGEREKTY
ncbi:unnamed protein product [Ilex paraguariensis]|uniref:Uncharacterized protein n=1 Tax=Ilex paraguariensis TaxID=185542 RepID=A0ABC8RZD2_9AQUA